MTQQYLPPPQAPAPAPPRGVNTIVVAVLCVLAVASLIAVAVVLVRDADDGEVNTSAPTTTRAQVPATTSGATTVPITTVTPPVGYGTTVCPPAGGTAGAVRSFTSPFQKCIDVTRKYVAVVSTNKGELTIQLDPSLAPIAVNNFVSLARSHYFDSTQCHRIITSFVVQCGDPTATGRGGPGYQFVDELPKAGQYKIGSLAMANSGANTNGSQFFIVTGAQGVALPPSYSLFGQVTAGADTTLKVLDAAGSTSGTPKEAISITSVRINES